MFDLRASYFALDLESFGDYFPLAREVSTWHEVLTNALLLSKLYEWLAAQGAVRGDVLELEEPELDPEDTNVNKYVWSGTGLERLALVNNCAILPQSYVVTENEFNPEYWSDAFAWFPVYWPRPDYRVSIITSLQFVAVLDCYVGTFTCQGHLCHFMTTESDYNKSVAALLNAGNPFTFSELDTLYSDDDDEYLYLMNHGITKIHYIYEF